MKTLKKALSFALVLAMVMGMIPFSAVANEVQAVSVTELPQSVSGLEIAYPYNTEVFQIKEKPANRYSALTFESARNEVESAQMVLTPNFKIDSFELTMHDLVNARGNVIGADAFEVYVQHYITVTGTGNAPYWTKDSLINGTEMFKARGGKSGNDGTYPDALIPQDAAIEAGENSVAAGNNQGVWVNLNVGDAAPGTYTGYATLTVNGTAMQIPVSVRIYDVRLSDQVHMQSSFQIWWDHLQQMEGYYPVDDSNFNEFKNLAQEYFDYLVSKRIMPYDNWSKTRFDSTFPDYAAEYLAVAPEISSYGLYHNYLDFAGVKNTLTALIQKNISLAQSGSDVDLFKKAYFLFYDEPESASEYAEVNALSDQFEAVKNELSPMLADYPALQASFNNLKHIVTAQHPDDATYDKMWKDVGSTKLTGSYIYCPQYQYLNTAQQRAYYDQEDALWWYGCCFPTEPFATYHINSPLVAARAVSWMMYDYDIDGMLYASVNNWGPYNSDGSVAFFDIWNGYTGGTPGDSILVYPGSEYGVYGPIGTVRLENIRESNEDYEYLWLLENEYGITDLSAYTNGLYEGAIVTGVYDGQTIDPDGDGNTDAVAIHHAKRIAMLDKLEELSIAKNGATVVIVNDEIVDSVGNNAQGELQADVTNNSSAAWKVIPALGTEHNWAYPQFVLDQEYALDNQMLAMDVKPVNMESFRINLSVVNGGWLSGVATSSLAVGEWTTVYFDLSATTISTFNLGVEVNGGSDYAFYIDNVRLVNKETAEDDRIHMNIFANTSYTTAAYSYVNDVLKAEGSTSSLKVDTASNVHLCWDFREGKGKVLDLSNTAISAYFYFADGKPYAEAQLYQNSGWTNSKAQFTFKDMGDGWYYGTLKTNADSLASIDTSTIILLRLWFNKGTTIYIDGMRYEKMVDKNDIFTGGSQVGGSSWTSNMSYMNNCTEVYGEDSISAWKFSATAANANQWAQFIMGMTQSHDMRDYELVFDAKVNGAAKQQLNLRPRTGADGSGDPCNNTTLQLTSGWNTYTVDFSAALKGSSSIDSLAAVQRIMMVFDFAATTGSDRSVIIDNVRLVKKICPHTNTTTTTVNATCAAAGSVTVTCDKCGETISTETIPALEHKYTAVVTPPTFETNGYTTYTCSACGNSYVDDEVPAYTVSGDTMDSALNGNVVATIYLNIDSRLEDTQVNVKVGDEAVDYTMTEADDGTYALTVKVAAAQMTDEITVQVVSGDLVSKEMTYTIRQYAKNIIDGDYKDTTKALAKAMLNYGAAAQKYFNYNTENLANMDYEIENTVEIPAVDTSNMVSGSVDGIRYYGASLVYESKVAVRFYFAVTGDINDYSFSIGNDPVLKDGLYYVEVADIDPQDYSKNIVLTVNDAMTVTYCPLTYISRMVSSDNTDLVNLVKAMYQYHLAVQAYLAVGEDVEVKEEIVVNDWTNMNIDKGMSSALSYEISAEKFAPGSSQSLKITTKNGDVGYVVLNSQDAVSSGALEVLPDFSNGKITAWFYFGEQRPMAFLRPVDSTWTNGVSGSFEFEDMGNGWYLGSVSTSELQYDIRKTGQKINEVIRIAIEIPGGYTVYVDNMQWEPIAATDEMEQASDLLAVSTIVEEYTNIMPEISTDEISGIHSKNSWKFSAAAGVSEKKSIRYELPASYDMTHQALSLDVHRYDVNVTHGVLLVSLQDSNGNTVVDALVDNIYWQHWNHLEVDLYKYLEEGKSLADVKYITFTFYFDTHTEYDRYYYIDNVAITPYETYETELSGTSALYIGDSISIARPFKGWAGLLEERYGVKRTNVSIGGYSLSTIGNQIKDQLSNVPADSEFDYIILDGGINDIYLGATEYGKVSTAAITAPPSAFDDSTAIGAFEQLMSMIKRSYPTAKIGYVITYQRDARWTEQFVPEVIKACEKWGISYLCLPATDVFNDMFNENAGAHTADTVHATVEGYNLIMEYLPQWMEAIPLPESIEGFEPEVYDRNDLFTNASYGWSGSSWNDGNGLTWTNKSEDTYGEGSIKSWMFGAAESISSTVDYQVNLNGSYDMDGYYFVFDAKVNGAKSQPISIRPQSVSNGSPVDLAGYQTANLTGSWQTFMLDFSLSPWDAYNTYGLADVQRVTIQFMFNGTAGSNREVVIDNVRLVKKETVDADWINMSVDAGMSNAAYSYTDQMVKAEGSTMSLRLDTANAKINYTVSPQWQFTEKKVDMSSGILSGYFHFGEGGTAYAAAELVSDNWKYTGRMEFMLESVGDGWYYGTLDTSKYDFAAADVTAGANKANTIRVRLYFRQNLIVHVDGLQYEDRTDKNDLLADFTLGWSGGWSGGNWNNAGSGLTWDTASTETYGEGSFKSWKFTASSAVNANVEHQILFNNPIDMDGYYLAFEGKVTGTDSQKISMRPRGGAEGVLSDLTDVQSATLTNQWQTFMLDFSKAPWSGYNTYGLKCIQRLNITFCFSESTGDRTLYIDNVRLVKKETAQQDWIHMSVDAGMTNAGYSYTDRMVKAEGSSTSLRLDTANAKINYTLSPQWDFAEGKVDMSTGTLSGYFHFGEGQVYAAVELCSSWKFTNRLEFQLEPVGDGWYYGTINLADCDFSADNLAAGASMENIIRMRLCFRQNSIIHMDGLTLSN